MLHELVHNVQGPHNATFYKLLDEITEVFDTVGGISDLHKHLMFIALDFHALAFTSHTMPMMRMRICISTRTCHINLL